MRRCLILIAGLVLGAALIAQPSTATEDMGTPDVFTAACHDITDVGLSSDIDVVSCRRRAPDEQLLNSTLIHVVVTDRDGTKYKLDVYMQKSLWHSTAFKQLP